MEQSRGIFPHVLCLPASDLQHPDQAHKHPGEEDERRPNVVPSITQQFHIRSPQLVLRLVTRVDEYPRPRFLVVNDVLARP